jgi:hypothetical protein
MGPPLIIALNAIVPKGHTMFVSLVVYMAAGK